MYRFVGSTCERHNNVLHAAGPHFVNRAPALAITTIMIYQFTFSAPTRHCFGWPSFIWRWRLSSCARWARSLGWTATTTRTDKRCTRAIVPPSRQCRPGRPPAARWPSAWQRSRPTRNRRPSVIGSRPGPVCWSGPVSEAQARPGIPFSGYHHCDGDYNIIIAIMLLCRPGQHSWDDRPTIVSRERINFGNLSLSYFFCFIIITIIFVRYRFIVSTRVIILRPSCETIGCIQMLWIRIPHK